MPFWWRRHERSGLGRQGRHHHRCRPPGWGARTRSTSPGSAVGWSPRTSPRAGSRETVAQVEARGGGIDGHVFDIADVAAIRAMVDQTLERHDRVDVLVNNAGIGIDRPIEEIDEAAFERMLGVHVKGTFFCTQAVVPAMKARRAGAIVNVSSRWAQAGHHLASDYVAAKSAILGLTKAWAKELAPFGIRVNAIAPGGVWSQMVLDTLGEEEVRRQEREVPLGRWAQPEELSPLVAFLAGEMDAEDFGVEAGIPLAAVVIDLGKFGHGRGG